MLLLLLGEILLPETPYDQMRNICDNQSKLNFNRGHTAYDLFWPSVVLP